VAFLLPGFAVDLNSSFTKDLKNSQITKDQKISQIIADPCQIVKLVYNDIMSPRNHFFQVAYPKAAAQQQADRDELSLFVWHAFTKYTGLQKIFSFTVLPFPEGDQAKGQGITKDTQIP